MIARNSAFTYKGKLIDIKRIGEELGVRYAVEGSVRKAGGALRVNAQLLSTETGAHLWADRFDVGRDEAGYDVDDIVRQIGVALGLRLIDIESARGARERPANPDAADVLLNARALQNQGPTPQLVDQSIALYERAVELEPNSVTALAGLAEALLDSSGGGTTRQTRRKFVPPRSCSRARSCCALMTGRSCGSRCFCSGARIAMPRQPRPRRGRSKPIPTRQAPAFGWAFA